MGHYGCGVRKFQQLKKPEDIATYQLQPFEPNGSLDLYAIDSQSIKAILQNPHEELLIFFTSWCPNSKEYINTIIQLATQNNIEYYLITPDDWTWQFSYLRFKETYKIEAPMLFLDVFEYNKGHIHKRMRHFIQSFCSDCEEVGGFPSVILLDKNNHFLFKNVVNQKTVDEFSEIMNQKN